MSDMEQKELQSGLETKTCSPKTASVHSQIGIWKHIAFCICYPVVFVVLDHFTVNLQLENGPSVWYPPAALTFALLFAGGVRYVPLAFLTLLASGKINYNTPVFSFFGFGPTILVCVLYGAAGTFLRKQGERGKSNNSVGSTMNYVTTVLLTSAAVSSIGTAMLCNDQGKGWQNFGAFTFSWWIGDTVALLCFGPFLLSFITPWLQKVLVWRKQTLFSQIGEIANWTLRSKIQVSAQMLSILAILFVIFRSPLSRQYDLFYLCFLPAIWVALTFGLRGAILTTLALNIGLMLLFPSSVSTTEVIVKVHILQMCVAIAGMLLGASITEREAVQKQLTKRTAYFEQLIRNNPIATVVHNPQGNVEMCNLAFERLFQYSMDEIVGKSLDTFVAPPEQLGEAVTFTGRLVKGKKVHVIGQRRRKDATLIDVEIHGIPLMIGGNLNGVFALYEDLTERKKMEEQLLLSGKLQAVGRLAGGIAHDFNNIVGVIQGYAEYLLERLPNEGTLRESAQEILHASHRTSGMTRQLLAFSRKQILQPRVIDLNTVIRDFEKMLARLMPADIEQIFFPEGNLDSIRIDAGQLEQVIMNLAVNARDAMPNGGTLTISTSNALVDGTRNMNAKAGSYVVLSVHDTGIGMTAETKALIFDPFFSTKEKDKGTGLGLATVYGIVNQSGGFIEVDSALGRGSAFRIYFPQALSEPQKEASTEAASPVRGSETILLVEDDSSFRKMTVNLLRDAGYQVIEAENGSDGIQKAQEFNGRIHLLLTDIIMPKMRGPQAAKYLSLLRPDIKVLFMSGYTDGDIEKSDAGQEDQAFIQKPFSRAALTRKIREVLESQKILVDAG